MALSIAFFVAGDAGLKIIGTSLPAPQVIGTSSLLTALWLLMAGARFSFHRPVLLRGLLGCVGLYAYLTGLFHLPLAVATAIKMTSPLMLSLFASIWLRERGHYLAVVLGFAGMLMVTQPDAMAELPWLLLVLAATVANTGRDILTRFIPTKVSALDIGFVGSAMAAVAGAAWTTAEGWQPIGLFSFVVMVAAGSCFALAHLLLITAMRNPNMAAIGWLRYTALLWAVAISYLVWGDAPSLLALLGAGVIAASGLCLLRVRRGTADA